VTSFIIYGGLYAFVPRFPELDMESLKNAGREMRFREDTKKRRASSEGEKRKNFENFLFLFLSIALVLSILDRTLSRVCNQRYYTLDYGQASYLKKQNYKSRSS
jgi:hypothetical protein